MLFIPHLDEKHRSHHILIQYPLLQLQQYNSPKVHKIEHIWLKTRQKLRDFQPNLKKNHRFG